MKEREVQGGNVHSNVWKRCLNNELLSFMGDDGRCFFSMVI